MKPTEHTEPKRRLRGRPKREMPELPGPTMREVWQTIFGNAKPPDPQKRHCDRPKD